MATGADTFTFLMIHYLGKRFLEAFIFILIMVSGSQIPVDSKTQICALRSVYISESRATSCPLPRLMICYCMNFLFMPPSPGPFFYGFLFECHDYAVLQLVGTVGAVIMPHNLYLHSGICKERQMLRTLCGEALCCSWCHRVTSCCPVSLLVVNSLCISKVHATGLTTSM